MNFQLSRRQFLKGAGTTVTGLALTALAGCQPSAPAAAPVGEGAAAHVYNDAVEGLSLALVDGYGPGEADGILGEGARSPCGDMFCFSVVLVLEEFPRVLCHLDHGAVVEPDAISLHDAAEQLVERDVVAVPLEAQRAPENVQHDLHLGAREESHLIV